MRIGAYDGLAEAYDRWLASTPVVSEENVAIRKLFLNGRRWIPEPCLDLCCGTGAAISILNLSCKSYVGVDASEDMLSVARRNYPQHEFRFGDVTDPAYLKPGDVFASVVMLFPGFCGEDPWPGIMASLKGHLRPDSYFLSIVYGPKAHRNPCWSAKLDPSLGPEQTFTEQQLKKAFHGWESVDITNFSITGLSRRLPKGWSSRYLLWESKTLGRLPGEYLIVRARCPDASFWTSTSIEQR